MPYITSYLLILLLPIRIAQKDDDACVESLKIKSHQSKNNVRVVTLLAFFLQLTTISFGFDVFELLCMYVQTNSLIFYLFFFLTTSLWVQIAVQKHTRFNYFFLNLSRWLIICDTYKTSLLFQLQPANHVRMSWTN